MVGNKKIKKEYISNYTKVLMGHINLSMIKFPVGTKGNQLDCIARFHLWQSGMDYNHGTGHGVGSFLGVHEGPQSISPLGIQEIKKGMIISNEPGYYKENEYGIRIENLIVAQEMDKNDNHLYFKTLTLAPIDKNLICINMLNKEEITWVNSYHEKVFETLSKFMRDKELIWLKESCKPILQ